MLSRQNRLNTGKLRTLKIHNVHEIVRNCVYFPVPWRNVRKTTEY